MSDRARPGKATLDTHYPRTIAELGPGDHVCCLYKTEEEHRTVLTPFLRQGLERGEKVLYIVDAHTAEAVLGYLRDDGLDVEPYLARGQLAILTRDESYMQQGVFDPDGMIALLRAETDRALAQGYPALRVTGEMTWALRGLPGSERLIEYEAKLNEFFPGSNCLAICQYDQRAFSPAMLLDVLCTHPIAAVGTAVYDNFYYVPPADFLGDDPPAAQLGHWVEHLAERKQMTDALWAKTQEYIDTTNLTGVTVLRVDKDNRVSFVNDVMCEFLGRSREEILGTPIVDYLHPDDAPSTIQAVRRMVRSKGLVTGIVSRHVTPTGTRIMEWNGYPIFDEEGQYAGVHGTGRDITERKKTEEALRESEERLRILFEFAPDAYYLHDLEGNFVDGNRAAVELTGYKREELIGKSLLKSNLLPPEQLPEAVATVARLVQGALAGTEEFTLIRKDGKHVAVETREFPVKIGGQTLVLGIARDISERKQAEEALRESEERYRLITENISDVVWIADLHSKYTYVSPSVTAMRGYTPEELIGTRMSATMPAASVDIARKTIAKDLVRASRSANEPLRPRTLELELGCKDGSTIWGEIKVIFVRDSNGRPVGLQGITRDIAKRRQMEEERERLHAELELRAITDSLTGLYDHTHFYRRLAEEIDRSKRYSHGFALLMMDVDDFKRFNDSRGHQVGDEMLRLVARCIPAGLRRSDLAFRYGGDEFAAILPHADPSKAGAAVDRMNRRIARRLKQMDGDAAGRLSLSAGVACFPNDGTTADELVRIADAALYNAKWVARARDIMGQREDIQSLVSALVSRQGGAEGSAGGAAFRPEALHEQQARIVSSVASSIAVALKDAGVAQALEDPDLQVLATVGAAAEIKDRYIRGHPERTSERAAALAEEMGLSPERVRDIRIAALLHDIGKVTVSEGILNKPGKLTRREFDSIKDHPIVGATLVSQVKGFEQLVPIVRHHHERFDGTGYPDGLAGEDIPPEARILSVVDVFDALTHQRSYRKAQSQEDAIAELGRGAGTQFDPAVVKAFLALVKRRGQKWAAPAQPAGEDRPLVAAPAARPPKR